MPDPREPAPDFFVDESSWDELEPCLDRLLEFPPGRRAAAAEALYGERPALLEKLSRLLGAIDDSESWLGEGLEGCLPDLVDELGGSGTAGSELPAETPPPDRLGRRLGDYRIDGWIGRGGMSDVYSARRADGAFDRRVAIKIARESRGGSSVSDRLAGERQILAELDHPHIARLLDAGLTADGLQYAVVEYVEGRSIDAYCKENRADLETRLRLFLEICEAVDHAHRRLIIHRDLKPANVLVDHRGSVKLLDFGIAELLDPQLRTTDGATLYLTPEYAAPEQFLRAPLSTATDVFALGALLFELLTDRRLRQMGESSPPRWIEQALGDEPPRPSAVVDDDSVVPPHRLKGDLDAVVRKALAPDPEHRYPGAKALADDLRNHLGSRPVIARQGARGYAARRFWRRHRAALSAGVAVLLLVLGAAATAMLQARRAETERLAAVAARQRSEEVSSFLVELFDGWDPFAFRHGEVGAKDLLDLGTERASAGGLEASPGVRAELLLTLARVHLRLGLLDRTEEILDRLREIEPSAAERAEYLGLLGHYLLERGEISRAVSVLEQALREEGIDPDGEGGADDGTAETSLELLNRLGSALGQLGRNQEAERAFRRALAVAEASGSAPWRSALLANLAGVIHPEEGYDLDLLREAIAVHRAHDVEDPEALAAMLNNLSIHLIDRGRWSQALEVREELQRLSLQILGPEHPNLGRDLINMARLQIDLGAFHPALDRLDRAEAILKSAGIESGPHLLALRVSRGRALAELGEEKALDVFDDVRTRAEEELGADHPWIPMIHARSAEAHVRLGRFDAALDLAHLALEQMEPDNLRALDAELARGAALAGLGRCEEALPILQSGVEKLAALHPPDSWRLARARGEAAACGGPHGVRTP